MRIDKFFSNAGILSRSQTSKAAKAGSIAVDGVPVRDVSLDIDPDKCTVTYNSEPVEYRKNIYIVMNKPEGYVCSNDEPGEFVVFDLLDEKHKKMDLFTVGRLDKATVGLIIITNDGKTAHASLSPKHHVEKVYEYETADPLSDGDAKLLQNGIELADGYKTKPCKIEKTGDKSGRIVLTEGKYHQIRRMFAAVGNKIVFLKRVSFGRISLDGTLKEGGWRYMTDEEEKNFTKVSG